MNIGAGSLDIKLLNPGVQYLFHVDQFKRFLGLVMAGLPQAGLKMGEAVSPLSTLVTPIGK